MGSEALLVHHFRTNVAELISFPSPDYSNPFFSHILPLIHSSLLVHTAVEAVAAAHLHVLGTGALLKAEELQSKTLKLLADNLSPESNADDLLREQTLAGSLLLVYYEVVLGSSARIARCHLQGVKAILDASPHGIATPRFSFLYKIFQYFDVTVSLSLHERPLGTLAFPIDSLSGIDGTFGLVGTLWPKMHMLADVLARSQDGGEVTDDVEYLERELLLWIPEEPEGRAASGNSVHEQAMVYIAKAYKYCGLLTLYSKIMPRPELSKQTYQQAFNSLLRVSVLSGPMSTVMWPLYTVAMLASTAADKIITQHIYSKLNDRQHMKVVVAASDNVSRHWKAGFINTYESSPTVLLG